ncbi:hypothetical protein A3D71_03800 [Candidatus Kaiserbacteria bacterium RIFCSPHIGHO2_02_FULL_55_20]|uniref:Uncharacterized protein n=1 Tax=Candidatus Kaiserbacteria bacterium RIFCSPHIGHO2_02_FULL_55_20 TaxID=1798497 RepID=A0A1F6DY02_9BACT|nr:MAG: hypothetical protein A2680_00395 [Candidatus Kaiserbacteria bacterium RIFCSPHIGHO2_01_FULL_55_37]OGG66288.1 MAG: hypothetical protein A3D71_03800 [Candidatus Kaiserbacteria bacterium RIFCSPHIGHO2_02_FULL_55_20]
MAEKLSVFNFPAEENKVLRDKLQTLRGNYGGNPIIGNVISNVQKSKELLHAILSKHLHRSMTSKDPDFLSYSIFQFDNRAWSQHGKGANKNALMEIIPDAKTVLVNDEGLRNEAFINKLDIRVLALHCLIHEVSHSIAVRRRALKAVPGEGYVLHETQGVRHSIAPVSEVIESVAEGRSRESKDFLVFFDETLNDELAEEIVRELCSTTGLFSSAVLDTFYTNWRSQGDHFGESQRLLDGITRSMAEKTGIEAKTIRNSLRRAITEGRNLFVGDSDMPAMDEVMGQDFTSDLSKIHDPVSIGAFIKKYRLE